VVEPVANLGREHPIKSRQVDDHPCRLIELRAHRHVAHVAVTVVIGAGAEAEHFVVPLIGPAGDAVAVRGGEGDAASQVEGHGRGGGLRA
jgi:hypothetical protein